MLKRTVSLRNIFGLCPLIYNAFNVYRRELAPGTVSLTGDRAQGDESKHCAYSRGLCIKVYVNNKGTDLPAHQLILFLIHFNFYFQTTISILNDHLSQPMRLCYFTYASSERSDRPVQTQSCHSLRCKHSLLCLHIQSRNVDEGSGQDLGL